MSAQGITFKVSEKTPEVFNPTQKSRGQEIITPEDILKHTWQSSTENDDWMNGRLEYSKCKELIQTSVSKDPEDLVHFVPTKNGFVDTVMAAYNNHHNLVLRADDIWIAILSQLNIYINSHAEELRDLFVAHKGKKNLLLVYGGNRWTFDFSIMAKDFSQLLQKNIKVPTFYDLIIPDFSTTTPHDTVTCSIIMMSILKSYFSYEAHLLCGIPQITLLGTREDYENILRRLQQLGDFEMGPEPRAFAALLQPIIRQFIAVFDAVAANPTDPKIDIDFWSKICHKRSFGSGEPQVSGWITAFCLWETRKATWMGPDVNTLVFNFPSMARKRGEGTEKPWWSKRLTLDGMEYPSINMSSIPSGICQAEVKLNDNGQELDCMVVAGHLGIRAVTKGEQRESTTIAPAPAWFMFEEEEVVEQREVPDWIQDIKRRTEEKNNSNNVSEQ